MEGGGGGEPAVRLLGDSGEGLWRWDLQRDNTGSKKRAQTRGGRLIGVRKPTHGKGGGFRVESDYRVIWGTAKRQREGSSSTNDDLTERRHEEENQGR